MKITRAQLRKIIKEAVATANQQPGDMVEAALVLRFVGTYLFAMRGVLRAADNAKYREGYYPGSQYMAITNFWKSAPIMHIRHMGRGLTDGQEQMIDKADAKAMDNEAMDVRENDQRPIVEKVDDLITYLYDQTPMGMSAIEAAAVYGNDIRNHAAEIVKFFDDRAEYFNTLEDATEFDREK